MKATLCLLADFDAENFCRDFMVEASERSHVGVAAGNLPRHISLGFPYDVTDWESYLEYAKSLAKWIKPVSVKLTDMVCSPIFDVTGSYFFKFDEKFGLDELRRKVSKDLNSKLGVDVSSSEKVFGQRNITLGFGSAPFSNYEEYVGFVDKNRFVGKELGFDQLGVFYYDSDKITATSFICCRRFRLNSLGGCL